MTTRPELFELKVLVEAHDWHDVAALMASVDRALDPHQTAMSGDRRWSVVANRLPANRAHELREFLDRLDRRDHSDRGSTSPVAARNASGPKAPPGVRSRAKREDEVVDHQSSPCSGPRG